jgi:SAM-dependent methyltransferase
MQQILKVWPSAAGLLYQVAGAGEHADPAAAPVLDVDVDGRRIWSFREIAGEALPEVLPDCLRHDAVDRASLRFQPWPVALIPRLRGSFRLRLRSSGTDDGPEVAVTLGDSTEPLRLVDAFGQPLVVNKWGRLGHALVDADPGMVGRMLDHMDAVRTLLEERLGPTVFVTGGTLLGPIREDRLLPHDDDADLAYLSRHTHPADVAVENFEIGRLLRGAGYDVVRLSIGHLQMQFSHEGAPDHYVDLFTGFLIDGYWMQHFGLRHPATRQQIVPPNTILVEGRPEPAPREPEVALHAIYGEGWPRPDPSFTFEVPPATADRFYGWWADYNVEREEWEDLVVLAPSGEHDGDDHPSAFVRWAHERAPDGAHVLELGCGTGADAHALGALGRSVRALDFSRHAIDVARARAGASDGHGEVRFEVFNLLDTRQVIRLGAELASSPDSWTVVGRRLLNALEDRGRHNVFRLCSMLLRHGGNAYFDVVTDHDYPGIAAHRQLTVAQVAAEAAQHRLVLEEAEPRLEPLRWFGPSDEQIVEMHRMTFRRRAR